MRVKFSKSYLNYAAEETQTDRGTFRGMLPHSVLRKTEGAP
jgi:hypothetical protein